MSGTWKIRNSDLHDIDLAVKESPLRNSKLRLLGICQGSAKYQPLEEGPRHYPEISAERLTAAKPR
jgi:hypothetical protein